MPSRTTRAAVARQVATPAPAEGESETQQLSSPPSSPLPMRPKARSKAIVTPRGKQKRETVADGGTQNAETTMRNSAAKSAAARTPVKSSKTTPKAKGKIGDVTSTTDTGASKKRKRTTKVKIETDPNELPHGLGKMKTIVSANKEEIDDDILPSAKKTRADSITITKEDVDEIKSTLDTAVSASALVAKESPEKKPRRSKKPNQYGVTLGVTPYPEWSRPTLDECQKVNGILSEQHGAVAAPASIPLPSLTVAGCGEVPNILEALLRTVLSAHTSNGNAAMAVQGLIKRFGVLELGMSQGSIDWNAARLAGKDEIEEAIKRGGLAKSKSKAIEGILNMVHSENEARRAALATKTSSEATKREDAADHETNMVDPNHTEAAAIEKASEVMLADTSALTLDYIHAMSTENAFAKLITYPSIGVKTAACTLLFCMQRPSFAVDTHVFRLCKWLGWVPPEATRDSTFAHCDVRIPNELKYSLHQLLIRHGKACGRCRAITGESSVGWEEGCIIDELLTRTGKKKGGLDPVKKSKSKKTVDEEDEDMTVERESSDSKPKRKATPKVKKATKGKATEADIEETQAEKRTAAAPKGKVTAKVTKEGNGKTKKAARARKAKKVQESETEEDNIGETVESDAEDDEDYTE